MTCSGPGHPQLDDRGSTDELGRSRSGWESQARKVSVVVPALNEEHNLPAVLARLPLDVEVILVDGGSGDRTVAVVAALRPSARLIRQSRQGKGNALACGFAAATGDIIVMIDADGSTDPREIPRFVAAIDQGAMLAKGSRFLAGGHSEDITPVRRWGNWLLNALANLLLGTHFTDLCYGYNAFDRAILPYLRLPPVWRPDGDTTQHWADGFEIETIVNMRAAIAGLTITEVPSVELPRIFGRSKLSAVRDGLRVLRTIIHEFIVQPDHPRAWRRRARRRNKAARRPLALERHWAETE